MPSENVTAERIVKTTLKFCPDKDERSGVEMVDSTKINQSINQIRKKKDRQSIDSWKV